MPSEEFIIHSAFQIYEQFQDCSELTAVHSDDERRTALDNNMYELNLDEMEKVTGGSSKTIISPKATVYQGPGKRYARVGMLNNGTIVNFTGTVNYNDDEGITYFLISSPIYGWVSQNDLKR